MILTHWTELEPRYRGIVAGFMNSRDVTSIPTGRYDLEDGSYVNVDCYETRENTLFEAHKKYVDVQLMVEGEEEIFCAPLECGALVTPYSEEKDCWFFTCQATAVLRLTAGMAAVLEPADLHAPCNWHEKRRNRKLVFKIPVTQEEKV